MERDWVYLNIDERHMWVSLTLKQPEGEENIVFTSEFIESYLKDNGIKAGIDKEAIAALVEYVEYGREVIVAKGKAAVDGQNGFYQYMVSLEDAKNKPKINKDGSVDYYNSLKLAMVKEGELIALYVPATNGEYGYTVFSEIIPPVKGKDLRPIKGKGFVVSEDGREYRAAFDGRIYKQQDSIIVEKIYIVNHDLDISEGNISFNGDVEIRGDVRSGLKIEAGGDIFVHGHVGACLLSAGGNITIKKGIQGRERCRIISKKDVVASFVERCEIHAEGNVYADYLLDAVVSAGQKVTVTTKRGCIVGGEIYGKQGIIAKEAGNSTNVTTKLSIGINPEDVRRVNEMKRRLKKLEKDIELLDKNMKIYEKMDGSKRTKETEALRMKIVRAKVTLNTEYTKLKNEVLYYDSENERARLEAVVHISCTVYPGVLVCIGNSMNNVKYAYRDVEFKLVNQDVIMKGGHEDDD